MAWQRHRQRSWDIPPHAEYCPDHRIPNYRGPYPIAELGRARRYLIQQLQSEGGHALEVVKPKLGIASSFGPACPPPPPIDQLPPIEYREDEDTNGLSNGDFQGDNYNYQTEQGYGQNEEEFPQNEKEFPQNDEEFGQNEEDYFHNENFGYEKFTKDTSNQDSTGPAYGESNNRKRTASQTETAPKEENQTISVLVSSRSDSVELEGPLTADESSGVSDVESIIAAGDRPVYYSSEDEARKNQSSGVVFSCINRSSVGPSTSTNVHLTGSVMPFAGHNVYQWARDPSQEDGKKRRLSAPIDNASTSLQQPRGKYLLYKCDFCPIMNERRDDINDHLINAQHYSASLYYALDKQDTNKPNLVSIIRMLAVVNTTGRNKRLVIMCPECEQLYDDIFMCGLHSKYGHGHEDGIYSICPVIHQETLKFSQTPLCESCSVVFSTHKELNHHWKEVPDHSPCELKPTNTNIVVVYTCPYCLRLFYGNLINAKNHVQEVCKSRNPDNEFKALDMKHVLKVKQKISLCPLDEQHNPDGLQYEMRILQNMKEYFQKCNKSKQNYKVVTARMRYLQKLIASKVVPRK